MPTLVLQSSWKNSGEQRRGSHRRRSIQLSLQPEIEHGSTDGFHHQKEHGLCAPELLLYILVMRCESVALWNLE